MSYDSEEGFTNEANNSNTGLKYYYQSGEQKYCVVAFCNNNTVNCGSNEPNSNSEIVFHAFPSDTVMCEKWLKFCNIYTSISNEYQKAQICSVHFNKDNYESNYSNEKSLHPIKVLKKDAVPTLNRGIKIEVLKRIEYHSSRKEHKQLVDKLLTDYEEQQKNEKGRLNVMVTKDPMFFSPKINPNAKLDDTLKLSKSEDNPIIHLPLYKAEVSLSVDKACQVIIPCNDCKNKSLTINKLLRDRAQLLKCLNIKRSWNYRYDNSSLKRMIGCMSLLLMKINDKKSPKKVDSVQDAIEKVKRGWSIQDTSDILCQVFSNNAYDEFTREFGVINPR